MSKFKLEFTLKQHTPLIHFQSDQSGATLRATELKPKFDRFLIEQLSLTEMIKKDNKDVEVPKDNYKHWFIGDGKKHLALDYKVKIEPLNEINIFDIAPKYKYYNYKKQEEEIKALGFPIFFASIDKEWNEKSKKIKFSLTDNIQITITTFHSKLKKIVEDKIALFFYLHNFGMRQSKGFGSFSVVDGNIDDNIIGSHYYIDIDINYLDTLSYKTPNNKKLLKFNKEFDSIFLDSIDKDYKNNFLLFKAIDLFYKTLRSGINFNKFYFKSLMFLYAKEKLNVQWDKKLFKSNFLNSKYKNEQVKKHKNSNCDDILTYETEDKYLLRDCLGLSTIQEYNYSREYKNSEKFTIRHPNTDTKKLDTFKNRKIEPNNITRLQSPLFIKPISINDTKYRVFLIPKQYPKNIFNEEITVLKVKNKAVEKKLDKLKLYPNFDLEAYLDFAFSKDIQNHIEKCGTDSNILESQLLIKIYTHLNKQASMKKAQK